MVSNELNWNSKSKQLDFQKQTSTLIYSLNDLFKATCQVLSDSASSLFFTLNLIELGDLSKISYKQIYNNLI